MPVVRTREGSFADTMNMKSLQAPVNFYPEIKHMGKSQLLKTKRLFKKKKSKKSKTDSLSSLLRNEHTIF